MPHNACQVKCFQEKCEYQVQPTSTGGKTAHTAGHVCRLPSHNRLLIASLFPQVFPLFHALGANGLLLEYEDMFPYEGHLRLLRAKHAYRYPQPQRKQMRGAPGGVGREARVWQCWGSRLLAFKLMSSLQK